MKTALESASVAQLLGEDSDVSNGADEDCDCADQDGLSMENEVSVARSTRSQVGKELVSCDQQGTVAKTRSGFRGRMS
uniref:Uncharacterized protein n=1 Tax=Hyaloperonospora arabidopsidis (strain Emoy2) TaxID=559515 RepID=M4BYR1_HYAAE